jgi:hypothetical protein
MIDDSKQPKYVAYATMTFPDYSKKTGVLFMRKCGTWKIIDVKTFDVSATGSTVLPNELNIQIHNMIYEEKPEKPEPTYVDLDIQDLLG